VSERRRQVNVKARTEVYVDGRGRVHERAVCRIVGRGRLDAQEQERLWDRGRVLLNGPEGPARVVLRLLVVAGEGRSEGGGVVDVVGGVGVQPEVGGVLCGQRAPQGINRAGLTVAGQQTRTS